MRWKDEIYIFAILYSRHKRIGPLASEDLKKKKHEKNGTLRIISLFWSI